MTNKTRVLVIDDEAPIRLLCRVNLEAEGMHVVEDAIFEIDLDGALELFAQPKYGARRASSALKEFDNDPVSGKPIKVKDGRFGPYVTDGTTNATIPRAESVEDITFERAVELLQAKRDKGPAAPRGKRTTAKKAPAKKAPAKKSTA